ncbi:LPXTG cell wall anchor domain-containing protein, partial [Actibacterium sp.]|uniref:LPXTG cell wall anchor domain-containing protein n=1 Tax=Actibacterium sp. TaxID=1872125 RepID=UPI00356511E9
MMLGLGLAIGPAAAVIMTLPVEAARPHLRALTMGIYLAVYYGMMGLAPAALGALRDRTGDAGSPLIAAAVMMLICLALWALFRKVQRRG